MKRNAPLVGPVEPSRIFHLGFALPTRNNEELKDLLQNLTDPQNPLYRHWLSVEEYTARFGPTTQDYQALQDFVASHNLKIETTFANRKMVCVAATTADVEKILHVTMNNYQRPDGTTFYAPDREPSVDLQTPLSHISGLDNAIPPRSSGFHPISKPRKVVQDAGSASGGACYWGNDFRHAYAANVTLTGAGVTAAIVAEDNYYPADIAQYVTDTGITANPSAVTNLYYSGITSTTTPNNGGETSLDIEQILAMAPGISQLRVYLGTDGDQLLTAIASDNLAKSASTCFLWAPYDTTDTDELNEMEAQGQSFYAGSGDSGAYATSGSNDLAGWLMEEPNLCAVGGTNLTMNGTGASWASEDGWNGSGGGISPDEAIPSYQSPVPMTSNGGSTTNRNIPDVACVGDYVTIIYQQGTTLCLAGTSCATPLWNGFTALVNQQAALVGQPTMGFPNTPIYEIGLGPDYTEDFHDITSGNNGGSDNATGYNCVTGYDLVTGWGTPNGQALINDLAGVGNPTPTVTSTPTITLTPTPTPTASEPCPNWAVVGNATLGTAVTLTTATNGEVGAAWNKSCINLTQNFNLMFKAYFGAGSGADGIDFVLQNDPRGTAAIGEGGSDKGYSASGGGVSITPSVAFTLETYNSNGTLQPEEDGNDTSTCQYVLTGTCPFTFANSLCNGAEHSYSVAWNATAQTLTLSVDGPAVMTYSRNLVTSVFGGTSCVYYGFTAATGGANNLQYVYAINCLTSTNTPTSTATNTPTKTLTPSPTATSTHTVQPTNTLTPLPSSTPSASFTATATQTNSPTNTLTVMPSSTPTETHIFTSTNTSTSVPPTVTNTSTSTPTFIPPSNTFTSTKTNTPTPVAPTATASSTPTTVPPTATSTVPPTASMTPSATASRIPTSSSTSTGTVSLTATPPASPTLTSVNTPTATNTSVPTTSTKTGTPTPAPPTATSTSTTVFTGTSTATPTSVPPTNTLTALPSSTPTGTSTITSTKTGTPTSVPPMATPTLTAVPSGTPTATPTNSYTFTPTPTHTAMPPTSTPTPTFTPLPSFTATVTASSTPIRTATPERVRRPVIYPNPAAGPGPAHLLLPLTEASNVEISVFTSSFRKVNQLDYTDVQPGQPVPIPLTNRFGEPLANGLYYLVIHAQGQTWTVKLLVLR